MGQFSTALKLAMDQVGWNQLDLAKHTRSAVSQSMVSRYLLTNDLPKLATLEQICLAFAPSLRESLTAAYLTDQIPPSASELVAVTSMQESSPESPKFRVGRAPEGSILRRDLDALERAALKDPNLAKALNYLAASITGKEPAQEYYGDDLESWSIKEDAAVIAAQKAMEAEEGYTSTLRTKKKVARGE